MVSSPWGSRGRAHQLHAGKTGGKGVGGVNDLFISNMVLDGLNYRLSLNVTNNTGSSEYPS